jgi:gas vesicle protein
MEYMINKMVLITLWTWKVESAHDLLGKKIISVAANPHSLPPHYRKLPLHLSGQSIPATTVQIGGDIQQSPDHQVNNPEKSDDNSAVFSKQLERFMESVRERFDNLKSEIHSDNTKLTENLNAKIQAENSPLVEQIVIIKDYQRL